MRSSTRSGIQNWYRKYGILQAPTLVVLDHGETFKYVNVSNIQRYVDRPSP